MRRRPSVSLRVSRALIGLVTVWCLGCSSYEPLLGSLAKAGGAMVCDTDMAMPPVVLDASVLTGDRGVVTVSAANDESGYDCGCGGSCHAPSPSFATIAAARSPVPAVVRAQPSEPASVARTPLLPPPEFTA